VIEEVSRALAVNEADKRFMAHFYTMGFAGLVMEWLAGGMKERPETLIERLNLLIEGNFIRALHRFADMNK
jgi:hypothetical protein